MEDKLLFIFKVLDETGVSLSIFSELTQISRTTLHKWKAGGEVRDTIRLNIAVETAKQIQDAQRAGDLPSQYDTRKNRLRRLEEVIS